MAVVDITIDAALYKRSRAERAYLRAISDVDNSLTSAGFGTITSARNPRIVQLGLKFVY
jgi:hypothetical protein